ncbi:hypothetical protein GUJ93_ZPchr0007g5533 [Zizania palustris]|uniref:Uncharacterized protein n=1 Tax=Zizania palustris TaxID=103762 RepID=A0A8J5VXY6_ZIZPA|nr:hypothetical protein GUJ93_ZPchr0007g5533 [Zizania palustris]
MEEFQEADILWPESAALPSRKGPPFFAAASSEMCYYELAAACCSVPSSTARCSEGFSFLSGGSSNDDGFDEEELLEADVLWPDTVQPAAAEQPRGGGYHGWFSGDLGRAGRHAKPAAGWPRPAASSPIDIPVKVAARCR